jgi:hypothetical protein
MFSSALFTLLYPKIHAVLPLSEYPLEEARVVMVTIFTTITWIAVTFLTKNQKDEVKLRMLPIVEHKKLFLKQLLAAIFLGICFLLFTAIIWWKIVR